MATIATHKPAVAADSQASPRRTPLIAVCIATYKRPHLLRELLQGIEQLVTPEGHDLEIRIVDNDENESARSTVANFAARSRHPVRYSMQRERNIALTRNQALEAGPADLLAFIDDDEVPSKTWLIQLLAGLGDTFDLVIGDVVPQYETQPPSWVAQGRFHHKTSGAPGATISWNGTRTSNTMLRGSWVYDRGMRFDEHFGKSGAEDTELFKRIQEAGGIFGAAPASIVTEHVHPNQCTLAWLARRFWNNGINYERLVAKDHARHPLTRFTARVARGTTNLVLGLPLTLLGRRDRAAHAVLDLSRAFGGLLGWLTPSETEHGPGYRSSGCEQ